jgi:hypothetical protein
MKKIYAFMAAALMSASLFAAPSKAPTSADLASYGDLASDVILALYFDEAPCNDVVLVGTYNSWNTDDVAALTKFEKVNGFDGWYVASFTWAQWDDNGTMKDPEGKAVQLKSDGGFDWKYQTGDKDAWINQGGAEAKIEPGYDGEANVSYPAPGAYIYEIAYWKLHNTPCVVIPKHKYTIIFLDPYCEDNPEFVPAVAGDHNNWQPSAMQEGTYEGEFAWRLTVETEEGNAYKLLEANRGWDNEFQYYDAENDEWKKFGNSFFPETDKDIDIVIDYSDTEKYRYAQCGVAPEDPCDEETKYLVVVGINPPAGVPEAGIEIIGYDGWEVGTVMERIEETGWYVAVLENMLECGEFKFREAGTWDNEIVNAESGKSLDNIKFRNVWEDSDWKGQKCKLIELDYSAGYVWKANWSSVEDVVLTVKAQKVVVDGVMYIVRDNKLFNVQGAQIR